MAHILAPRTLKVAVVAHLAHETQGLRSACEAPNKRGSAFVLPASYFYSCARCHDCKTLTRGHVLCLCECAETFDEAFNRENRFFLRRAVAKDGDVLERFLASHDKQVRTIEFLGDAKLFGQRFNADVL